MRKESRRVSEMLEEFQALKSKLFGSAWGVEWEGTDEQKRFDQLLGFFYPQFRTDGWINPLDGSMVCLLAEADKSIAAAREVLG